MTTDEYMPIENVIPKERKDMIKRSPVKYNPWYLLSVSWERGLFSVNFQILTLYIRLFVMVSLYVCG